MVDFCPDCHRAPRLSLRFGLQLNSVMDLGNPMEVRLLLGMDSLQTMVLYLSIEVFISFVLHTHADKLHELSCFSYFGSNKLIIGFKGYVVFVHHD